MGTLRAAIVLSFGASLLVPAAALAGPTAKEKAKASELVKQAIAKSQGGDHETAVGLYEEAFKIIPQPLLLSNIGSEYQAMAKPVEALKYFCKYLEADPNGSNGSFVIAQAKTLYIELGGVSTVEDADVCKPIVKPPPPPPKQPDPVVDAAKPAQPGGPVIADPPHESAKASPLRWAGIGVGVVGIAVFGTGIYFGTKAADISDQITNHDPTVPWPSNIGELEDDGASYEHKQIGFLIGGSVAVAAGVAMYFLGAPKANAEGSASVSLTPVATPDTLGFAAAGRF
jgi:tetratricopeptide (TPR) repeat protein